jgi:hypothetical protein
MNMTSLNFSINIPHTSFSPKTQWTVGGFYCIKVSHVIDLQGELFYAQEGGVSKEIFGDEAITTTHKLTYIKIPLLIKFKLANNPRLLPVFLAGPYAAKRISAKAEQTGIGEVRQVDLKNYIKKWDFGWVLAGCLQWELKNLALSVEARYTIGFTNIAQGYQEIYHEFLDSDHIKNHSWTILFGIHF